MNQKQRLISLSERARNVEGSEKWPVFRCFKTPSGKFRYDWLWMHTGIELGVKITLSETEWAIYYGPLLPHNPLDPMNPAACLERAGVIVVHWGYTKKDGEHEQLVSLALNTNSAPTIKHNWPALPTYADYMEALLNLHDLAKSEGGEWVKAWARAMTPECEV